MRSIAVAEIYTYIRYLRKGCTFIRNINEFRSCKKLTDNKIISRWMELPENISNSLYAFVFTILSNEKKKKTNTLFCNSTSHALFRGNIYLLIALIAQEQIFLNIILIVRMDHSRIKQIYQSLYNRNANDTFLVMKCETIHSTYQPLKSILANVIPISA